MIEDIISEDEFATQWGIVTHPRGNLFTYADVKDKPLNQVWSIIDCPDDDCWIASPGFHVVNVIGYITTTRPWTDGDRDAIYA